MEQWGWTPESYQVSWKREIVAVNGNELTLDAPIVQAIEAVYGGARVYRYELQYNGSPVEIENVGVENMRIESIFASDVDENHGEHAIAVQRVKNGWVRQVTAYYFWRGLVLLRRDAWYFTVEDSAALEPKGTLAGGRRYPFNMDDSTKNLMQRCYAQDFRHSFASGSRTGGPNVWVDGYAYTTFNDIGTLHDFVLFICLFPFVHS